MTSNAPGATSSATSSLTKPSGPSMSSMPLSPAPSISSITKEPAICVTIKESLLRENRRMDQRIIALYDDFTHRHLDRRLFLEQATRLVGSTTAALAALSLLQSNRALGQIVPPNDA